MQREDLYEETHKMNRYPYFNLIHVVFPMHSQPVAAQICVNKGVALSYVEDLNSGRDFWNMKARVIRLWKQTFRWDMILLDERGKKIQASVKKQLVNDFAEHLKEDSVLLIRKFGVGGQGDTHRIIPLNHKINFFKCTSVTTVAGFQGHPYCFNLVPFKAINENAIGDVLTVDVIGRVAWCGDLESFKSGTKESKRLNIDLQNLEGDVLKCTLWSRYAEEFNSFIASHTSNEMVIVVIQHGRFKEWGGSRTVQNDMYGTRLFINEDLEEANDLRRSLILKDGASTSLTILSSQTVYPVRDDFVVKTPRKHVDELIEINEESSCVVVASIKILEEEFGWFYKACRKCHKKVLTKSEFLEKSKEIPSNFIDAPFDSLWCPKCKCMPSAMYPKFKVQFRVQDSTGSVSFVMFDKDVSNLLGISATDIRETQLKNGDMEVYPPELGALKNKLLAFKIQISKLYNLDNKYYVYTISKVCDDPELIAELQAADKHGELTPEEADPLCVKLDESSQIGIDSKDCGSVTGESLPTDVDKDSATSPGIKRAIPFVLDETNACEGSTSKRAKKKLAT